MLPAAYALESAVLEAASAFAVAMVTDGAPGQARPRCSGVLIAPNVIVTARHCFETDAAQVDCRTTRFARAAPSATGVWFTASGNAVGARDWHQARRIHVPPSDEACGADLAIAVLEDDMTGAGVVPASPRLERSWDLVATFAAIAHGSTGANANDAGRRHALWEMPVRCSAEAPCAGREAYFSEAEVLAGDGACDGDSGSGAFELRTTAEGALHVEVVGVLARTRVDRGHCYDAVYERLDAWGSFLRSIAIAAAHESGRDAPSWATTAAAPPVSSSTAPTPNEGDARLGCSASGGGEGFPHLVLGVVMGMKWLRSRSPKRGERGGRRRGRA